MKGGNISINISESQIRSIKDEILNDIYACIEAINLTLPENVRMPLEKNSLLVDTDSIFDSLSTINFFVSLEELYLSKGLSIQLLEDIASASGVKIFIGSENRLFEGTGCSLIIAPIQTYEQKVFGALGVIGPKRMNYSKIISMVDYTSQIVSKLLNDEEI